MTLALLVFAAFLAGIVDSIAGGGGLITVPALLAAGHPPHVALGINKGQAVFGSSAALFRFAKSGLVHGPRAKVAFPFGFVGSLGGAGLVLLLSPKVLEPLVLALLVTVALFLAFKPRAKVGSEPPPRRALILSAATSLLIGAYDGFFGPGTGTFLIFANTLLLGSSLLRASADAKVVNFASNLAAVAIFAISGKILWAVALPMALGQAAGGWVGAHLAVRGGDRLVRRLVLLVVLGLSIKLAHDLLEG